MQGYRILLARLKYFMASSLATLGSQFLFYGDIYAKRDSLSRIYFGIALLY